MAKYVDGFVLAVPKKNLDQYKAMAKVAAKVWIEHGALEYRECVGEDMKVKMGVPFPKMVGTKPSEAVVFAWITYKSRAQRDKVNAKVMADPRIQALCPEDGKMPFSMERFSYGGFDELVAASA